MISKTSSILGLITIFQLALGLFSQLFIIKILGVGELTDAFIAAQTIPAILSTILITVFQSVYLPSLSVKAKFPNRWHIEQGKAHAKLFIIFGGLFLILFLLSDTVLSLIFQGFDAEQIKLTKYLFIFFMISFWLNTHSHIFAITLRTIDKFILADSILLIGTILNLLLIFFLLNKEDIDILGTIYVVSSLMVFLVLYVISGRPKLIFTNIFKNNKNWKLMIPLIKGNMLYKTSPIVDRYLLSNSFNGGMTIFAIAQMFQSSIIKIIDKLLIVMIIPDISKLVKKGNVQELRSLYITFIYKIIVVVSVSFSLIGFYEMFELQFLEYLFNINNQQEEILINIILILHLAIFAGLSVSINTAYFYAFGDTISVTNVGIKGYFASIVLKIVLFYFWGILGFAIAVSIHQLGNFIVLHILLINKLKRKINVIVQ